MLKEPLVVSWPVHEAQSRDVEKRILLKYNNILHVNFALYVCSLHNRNFLQSLHNICLYYILL